MSLNFLIYLDYHDDFAVVFFSEVVSDVLTAEVDVGDVLAAAKLYLEVAGRCSASQRHIDKQRELIAAATTLLRGQPAGPPDASSGPRL